MKGENKEAQGEIEKGDVNMASWQPEGQCRGNYEQP